MKNFAKISFKCSSVRVSSTYRTAWFGTVWVLSVFAYPGLGLFHYVNGSLFFELISQRFLKVVFDSASFV